MKYCLIVLSQKAGISPLHFYSHHSLCFQLLLRKVSPVRTAGGLLSLYPCHLVGVAFFKDCYFVMGHRFLSSFWKENWPLFPPPCLQSCRVIQDRLIQQCANFFSLKMYRELPLLPCISVLSLKYVLNRYAYWEMLLKYRNHILNERTEFQYLFVQ